MIYPKFIDKNSTIGVSAPSDGCYNKIEKEKMKNSIKKIEELGFKVRTTDNCKTSILGRSSDDITRARELENLFLDSDVDAIISLSGGDFLVEILSVLRYDIIWNNPKWIQGYSDPTGLLFTITTNLSIATIYGSNFKTFSMPTWHKSLIDNFEILQGNLIKQSNYDYYSNSYNNNELPYTTYELDKEVKWEEINNKSFNITGRTIGGCLEVLLNIIGTKYDKTNTFLEKYKEDGFIWYFDIYDMSNEDITRALWQLKNADWFKYTKGIIFGRLVEEKSIYETTLKDTLINSLNELNIPVIYNADLGHTNPRITIINGAIMEVNYEDNKANLQFFLK